MADFSNLGPRENFLYFLTELEQAFERGVVLPVGEINEIQRRLILLAELIGRGARRL